MRIAIAQINPTVGDIGGNAEKVIERLQRARREKVDLLIAPELAVFGYPPKDLVWRRDLVRENVAAVERIAKHCEGIVALVGYVRPDPSETGKGVFNAAAVCRNGAVEAIYAKMLLPTYDVFDESRYFNAGDKPLTFTVGSGGQFIRFGVTICEDLWNNQQFEGRRVYGVDPVQMAVEAGAQFLINLSASPYRVGVQENRESLFSRQVREHRVPLIYVNQVAGNDDLIFDGASIVLDQAGSVVARARPFEEDFLLLDWPSAHPGRLEPYPDQIDGVRGALVLGIKDYMRKCGFEKVLVGLSGGIDSAVTAALAVEALGADRVRGVAMPSRYSSPHSLEDAKALAQSLGIAIMSLPIERIHASFEQVLREEFAGRPRDVTEENIQARVRGSLLMALCNKFGWLLLTTGNKSEIAVGYCTLYGDMCGGLAVLSDVPKTFVYELAHRINESAGRELIPRRTIEKPPSAELRENQRDQDTLPPYDVLDPILEQYVEQERAIDEIAAQGFDRSTVEKVSQMVRVSEYKRKQAAVGLKVTSRAFGTGRRMPIAAKYR